MDDTSLNEPIELRIVLVGKTGVGKSGLGNSLLLDKDVFKSTVSATAVTTKVECKEREVNLNGKNRRLKVFDTPGLFDATRPLQETLTELMTCMLHAGPGPHIFLFVIKSSDRISTESIETIEQFKARFGESVLKYTIIIFTAVDQLGNEVEEWLKAALQCNTKFKEFMKSCGNRYFFINNIAGEQKLKQSVKKVLHLIYKTIIKNCNNEPHNGVYTSQLCDIAAKLYKNQHKHKEEADETEAERKIIDKLPSNLKQAVISALEKSTSSIRGKSNVVPYRNKRKVEMTVTDQRSRKSKKRKVTYTSSKIRGRSKKRSTIIYKPRKNHKILEKRRGPIDNYDTIKRNIPYLLKNLTEPHIVYLYLFAKGVFDKHDLEQIKMKLTESTIAVTRELLYRLLDSGEGSFQIFIDCLQENGYNRSIIDKLINDSDTDEDVGDSEDYIFNDDVDDDDQENTDNNGESAMNAVISESGKNKKSNVPTSPRSNLTFFDLQTTGLGEHAHILQIAAIRGKEKFNIYVQPKIEIERKASELNGITYYKNQMKVNGRKKSCLPIKNAVQKFIDFLQPHSILVGHYCQLFDCKILYNTIVSVDLAVEFSSRIDCFIDSWVVFQKLYPNLPNGYKQIDLVRHFLKKNYNEFNAVTNSQALQKLFEALKLPGMWKWSFTWNDVSESVDN